jgi:hypothetical protein
MEYLLTSTQFEGSLSLKYDDKGWLNEFKLEAVLTDVQLKYFYDNLPRREELLSTSYATSKTLSIVKVMKELTFESFWNAFNYKMGKLAAEKQWNKLNDADKLACMKSIKKYHGYLASKPGIEKVYPERYISKRRFEDEYKTN